MFNQRHSPMKRHIILSIENLSVLKECYAKSSQNWCQTSFALSQNIVNILIKRLIAGLNWNIRKGLVN